MFEPKKFFAIFGLNSVKKYDQRTGLRGAERKA